MMGTFVITGPDGKKYKVTGDNAEGALQALKKAVGQQPEAVTPAQQAYNDLPWYGKAAQAADDTARFLANGMTLGYADKIAGYLGGEGTEAERAKTAAAQERAGTAGTAAEIVGSLAPVSAMARTGATAASLIPRGVTGGKAFLARLLASGADAGAIGAVQATGHDQDPLTGAGIGVASGIGGQAVGEVLSAGLSKAAGLFNKKPAILHGDELKQAGQQAYNRAEQAGVIFRPEAVDRLRQGVYDDFAQFGYHPKNQPGAAVAYDELARLAEGGNVSLKGLDTARKVAQGGFSPTNPSNNALLGKVTDRIDEFAANAGPNDVLTGDAAAASSALKEGRDYWQRFRKLEKVDELLGKAGLQAGSTGSGGNVENATRQQLKRLLTDKKLMRGLTADEKEAIRKTVLGTPTQNALRLAGKLSPQGNGLMLALGGAGSVAAPQIALPAMAVGYGSKKIAEALTRKNTGNLKDLIAVGGKKSTLAGPKNAVQRLAESKRDAIARLLSMSLLHTAPR